VKPAENKRPLRRPRSKRETNIRRNFKEIGLEGVEWINLALERYEWQALCENAN